MSASFFELYHHQHHPRTGLLLDGTVLPPEGLRAVMALHRRSFVTIPVTPRTATPPPSPGPSNAPPEGPWVITPDDISAPSEDSWILGDVIKTTRYSIPQATDYGVYVVLLWHALLNLV